MSVPYSDGRIHLTSGCEDASVINGIWCWRASRPRAEIMVSIPGFVVSLLRRFLWVLEEGKVGTVIGIADSVLVCDVSNYYLDIGFCFEVG